MATLRQHWKQDPTRIIIGGFVATASLAIIGAALYGYSSRMSTEREEKAATYTTMKGQVIEETQNQGPYSFSVQTNEGKRAFEVFAGKHSNPSSIDAIIQPGVKVEVDVRSDRVQPGRQVYQVYPDRIRVY